MTNEELQKLRNEAIEMSNEMMQRVNICEKISNINTMFDIYDGRIKNDFTKIFLSMPNESIGIFMHSLQDEKLRLEKLLK